MKKKLIGSRRQAYIQLVRLPYDIDLWVNEEGLLMDLDLNFRTFIKGGNFAREVQAIHRDVYFASFDMDGNTTSLSELQIKVIKHMFRIDRGMMMVVENEKAL